MYSEEDEDYIKIKLSGKKLKIGKIIGLIFIFIGIYFILGDFPIFSSTVIDPNAGFLLIFITGLLTSLHCVGMCSGFVVAYSTKTENLNNTSRMNFKPHLLYNGGRLVSYTTAGILAGLLGSIFTFTSDYRGYLSMFAGIFMIFFGLSTFIPWLRRFTTIRTPNIIKHTKNRGPLVFGLLNSLMPCGPLQAMLIYSAGTGSVIQGALTMFIFGLGTAPLMFGFGNVMSLLTHKYTRKIMTISTLFVMALGLIMLNRGLLLTGYGSLGTVSLSGFGLLGFSESKTSSTGFGEEHTETLDGFQQINMIVDRYGWNPDSFFVKKGIPVKWNIYVKELNYCNKGLLMPKYGLRADFTKEGETLLLEFTPKETGKFFFTCWMGMLPGDITVMEDLEKIETQIVREPGKTVLKIRGMCCSGCAIGIQRRLLNLDGIKSAEISFQERKATVNYDPEKITVGEIIDTIEYGGRYQAEEVG